MLNTFYHNRKWKTNKTSRIQFETLEKKKSNPVCQHNKSDTASRFHLQ
jgi:hypothetical protein